MGLRDDYLAVADSALELLRHPAVASRWDSPSALAGLTVGGLAAHLANQVLHIPQAPPASEPPISLTENFARAVWVGTSATDDIGVEMQRRSHALAAETSAPALAASVSTSLAEVRALIAAAPPDLVVHLIWTGWNLTFDDFLTTRLLELVVHSDDLAVSIDVPPPPIPPSAAEAVVSVLTSIALRRHGATAVIRTLSRAERAPTTITAL